MTNVINLEVVLSDQIEPHRYDVIARLMADDATDAMEDYRYDGNVVRLVRQGCRREIAHRVQRATPGEEWTSGTCPWPVGTRIIFTDDCDITTEGTIIANPSTDPYGTGPAIDVERDDDQLGGGRGGSWITVLDECSDIRRLDTGMVGTVWRSGPCPFVIGQRVECLENGVPGDLRIRGEIIDIRVNWNGQPAANVSLRRDDGVRGGGVHSSWAINVDSQAVAI